MHEVNSDDFDETSYEEDVEQTDKDSKIQGLKQQLRELKSRNAGLVNCLKNQDSAVRKFGSIVASRGSSPMSDALDLSEVDDVIDSVYKKVLKMNTSHNNDVDDDHDRKDIAEGDGHRSIRVSGQIKVTDNRREDKVKRKEDDPEIKGKGILPSKEDSEIFRSLENNIKRIEDDIFAKETAFRHLSREKPINDELLSLRLEQIRQERDKLFGILKHYEKIMQNEDLLEDSLLGQKHGGLVKPIKIDAAVTINNSTKDVCPNKEELLYHIEELRKCLDEIRNAKKRGPKASNKSASGSEAGGSDVDGTRGTKGQQRKTNGKEQVGNGKSQADWLNTNGERDSVTVPGRSRRSSGDSTNGKASGEVKNGPPHTKDGFDERCNKDGSIVAENVEALRNEAALFARKLTDTTRQKERALAERNQAQKDLIEKMRENEQLGQLLSTYQQNDTNNGVILRDRSRPRKEVKAANNITRKGIADKPMSEQVKIHENQLKKYQDMLDKERFADYDSVSSEAESVGRIVCCVAEKPGEIVKHPVEIMDERNHVTKVFTRRIEELEMSNREAEATMENLEAELFPLRERGKMLEVANEELVVKVKDLERKCNENRDLLQTQVCRNEMLEGLMKKIQEEKKELELRVRNTEGEKKELELKVRNTEGEKKELELKVRNIEGEKKELELKVRNTEGEKKELELKVENTEGEKNELQLKVKSAEGEKKELELKVDDLEKQGKHLKDDKHYQEIQLASLEDLLQKTNNDLEKEQEDRAQLEGMLSAVREKEEVVSKQADDLRERVAELQKLSKVYQAECNIAQNEEASLRLDMDKELNRSKELQKQVLELKKTYETEKENVSAWKDLKNAEEDKSRTLTKEIDIIKSEHEIVKTGMERESENMKEHIEELERENGVLENNKCDLQSKVEELQGSKDQLQTKLNARNEEMIEVQNDLGTIRGKHNDAKRELNEKSMALFQMKRDAKNVQEDHDKLKLKHESLEEEKKQAIEEMIKANQTAKSLQEELKTMGDKLAVVTEEHERLGESCCKKEESAKKLKKEVEELSFEKGALEEEVMKLKEDALQQGKTMEDLKRHFTSKEESLEEMKKNLSAKDEEMKKITADCELLEIRLITGRRDFIGLQKQLDGCWQENDNARKKLEESYNTVEELRMRLDKAEAECEAKDADMKNHQSWFEEREASIEGLNGRISAVTELVEQKDREIELQRKQIEEMNQCLDLKEIDRLRFAETVRNLDDENRELKEELSRLQEGDIKQLREEVLKQSNEKVQISAELDRKIDECQSLVSSMESMKVKHKFEIEERLSTWNICEEYNKSLKAQLENYKNREVKLMESVRLMKQEVGVITKELRNAKVILKDFQAALLDKDNDLKKINDAVVLLEKSYSARHLDIENKLTKLKADFDVLTNENSKLKEELVARKIKIEKLSQGKEECRKNNDRNLQKINYMEMELREKDKELFTKDGKLNMLETEVARLKMSFANDEKEVEDLVNKLERTLQDVRLQLGNVEKEKQQLKNEVAEGLNKKLATEDSLKRLVAGMTKYKNLSGKDGFQNKDPSGEVWGDEVMSEMDDIIERLKEEIFSLQREKDNTSRELEKKISEEILLRTSETIERENMKMQMKSVKEELEVVKNAGNSKDKLISNALREVEKLTVEKDKRRKVFEEKESDYKQKMEEMSSVVSALEKKIATAVRIAENERGEREGVLEDLLKSNKESSLMKYMETTNLNRERLESDRWRERAKVLTKDLDDLQEKFAKYRNKSMQEREGLLSVVENAKAEQITNLKKELAGTYKDKLAYESKLNGLSSELCKQREEKMRFQKELDALNNQYRMAKRELVVHKSEIDWLRNALAMKTAVISQ
eukprot:gene11912-13146_t